MSTNMSKLSKLWSASLVQDSWVDYISFHVLDPHTLTKFGYAAQVGTVAVTLTRNWNDICNSMVNGVKAFTDSRLRSSLIEASLSQVTTDRFIGRELKGDRGGYVEWNCAVCGGGMLLNECSGCQTAVKDAGIHSGWDVPLPSSLIKAARAAGFMRYSPSHLKRILHWMLQFHFEMPHRVSV